SAAILWRRTERSHSVHTTFACNVRRTPVQSRLPQTGARRRDAKGAGVGAVFPASSIGGRRRSGGRRNTFLQNPDTGRRTRGAEHVVWPLPEQDLFPIRCTPCSAPTRRMALRSC